MDLALRRLARWLPTAVREALAPPAAPAVVEASAPRVVEVPAPAAASYERLYEAHAQRMSPEESVGGDFEHVGRMELGLLQMEGFRPTDTVVDFGCGTGRLAVHLIPHLAAGGHFVGIDISERMLVHARALVAARVPSGAARVTWLQQVDERFALADDSVDLMCAFSVFTHMEHEDAYRYLVAARRVVKPGGRMIFSCLPMSDDLGRQVFLRSAALPLRERWSQVRNVTTSVDFMDEISRAAGWQVTRWYPGPERAITVPGESERAAFGQSACVLTR